MGGTDEQGLSEHTCKANLKEFARQRMGAMRGD